MANSDYNWEQFGQQEYTHRNYGSPLDADLDILSELVTFYSSELQGGDHIEIGVGPNLYPLMAAAPHCGQIHVTDFADSNLRYVEDQIDSGLSDMWRRWHTELQELGGGFRSDEQMVNHLRRICTYEQMSVFDLPENSYASSCMMFVAESITQDPLEYNEAVRKALRCVQHDGSFVAAFMLGSRGYKAGAADFPAVPIDADSVKEVINPEASYVEYNVIEHNVREGHEGMLLVTGRRS